MKAIPKSVSDYLSAIGTKGGMASSAAKTRAARKNATIGGSATTEAKREAARKNGKKGGRPPKIKKS